MSPGWFFTAAEDIITIQPSRRARISGSAARMTRQPVRHRDPHHRMRRRAARFITWG
jgi:hypothetical protein